MRRFLTSLAGLALIALLGVFPAMAAPQAGTQAWSHGALTLRSGPGLQYDVTGDIAADRAIRVLRCQKLWCVVEGDGGRGWASKDLISFGLTPEKWPFSTSPDYATGGPGRACFYQGANYTGAEFCVPFGRTIDDLALLGLDNGFSSVMIEGTISVAVCRDRNFQSYCERITASQPALDPFLRRALSSIRIH